jgi:hypothetical protein
MNLFVAGKFAVKTMWIGRMRSTVTAQCSGQDSH